MGEVLRTTLEQCDGIRPVTKWTAGVLVARSRVRIMLDAGRVPDEMDRLAIEHLLEATKGWRP